MNLLALEEAMTGVELRYDEDQLLDEIVAVDAVVHLERMNRHSFALIVEASGQRVCVMIGATTRIDAAVSWEEWK